MKTSLKRILSTVIVACMLLATIPAFSIGAFAETETLLEEVTLEGTTIKNLENRRITGNVYTVAFWLDIDNTANVAGLYLFNDGTSVNGIVTDKGNTNRVNILNGGEIVTRSIKDVERYVDADGKQYFKAVVDGESMIVKYYAKTDANGTFTNVAAQQSIDWSHEAFCDYLTISFYNPTGAAVSVGGIEIYAGDTVSTESAYDTLYASKNDGDTLFDVDFAAARQGRDGWLYQLKVQQNSGNYGDILSDGTYLRASNSDSTVVTDASENAEAHLIHFPAKGARSGVFSYLPYYDEMLDNGSFTIEMYFFLNSGSAYYTVSTVLGGEIYDAENSSVDMIDIGFVTASSGTNGANPYAKVALEKYNSTTTVNKKSLSWAAVGLLGNRCVGEAATFQKNMIAKTNDTSADACNVKIEVDTTAQTMTQYVLRASDNTFVKTAVISYAGTSLYPMLGFVTYVSDQQYQIHSTRIKKGLTESDDATKLVEFTVDDGEATFPEVVGSATTLPTAEKDWHTVSYTLADGTPVSDIGDISLVEGYNKVALKAVYTPIPVENNIELRGIQAGIGDNAANIRLIGTMDSDQFEAAGFVVTCAYRDAQGNIHTGTKTLDLNTTVLYDSVIANTESGLEVVTADKLGGKYLVALVIQNVPLGEGVQIDFRVIPYTVIDGEKYYGEESILSFINGKYSGNVSLIVSGNTAGDDNRSTFDDVFK